MDPNSHDGGLSSVGERGPRSEALWLYGIRSMFALRHYWYAPPASLPLRIGALIAFEAASAGLLLVFAPLAVRTRPAAA